MDTFLFLRRLSASEVLASLADSQHN